MTALAALAAISSVPGWHRAKTVRAAAGIAAPLADVIAALDSLVAAGLAEVRQTDRGPVHADGLVRYVQSVNAAARVLEVEVVA